MSPAGLLRVFVGLALIVIASGTGFALLGAWPVLPFAGLEVLGLGAAFVVHARRAGAEKRPRAARNVAELISGNSA